MNLREYVAQYKNSELCAKWNNNIPASELGMNYAMVSDSQEIQALCENFTFLPADEITGALLNIKDGDYGEVYVTESSRPYSLDAIYHPLDYYLE